MAKIRAVVAGASYLVIVSLAAYNLRAQLFGTNIPSASASSPAAVETSQAVSQPAASSSSSSASSGTANPQSELQTPAQPATQSPATSGKSGPTTKPALTQEK